MLKYRINRRTFNKSREELSVNNVKFINFEELLTEDERVYDGYDKDKLMIVCECDSVDKIKDGDNINTVNELTLTYEMDVQQTFTFNNDYQVKGVNKDEKSFSFLIDKYDNLEVESMVCGYENYVPSEFFENKENDNIFLFCKSFHYFDIVDNIDEDGKQQIPIYFKYSNSDGEIVTNVIFFKFYNYSTLSTSLSEFLKEENIELFKIIFNVEPMIEVDGENYYIVCPPMPDETVTNGWKIVTTEENNITYYTWKEKENPDEIYASEDINPIYGNLNGIDIKRETFLFGERTFYEFVLETSFANIDIPLISTFENNLFQTELLNEYFVDVEKRKAINSIVDVEKDVYYPCIYKNEKFQDIYTIRFNLHFREHRTDDWIIENNSFWNGVEMVDENDVEKAAINTSITSDDVSDLLAFLNFTNDDVYFQKNKLKKSFLRLSFYDSMNPGNQNLLSYSTIFINSGELFSKYAKLIESKGYNMISFDKNNYGEYALSENKVGIRVNRETIDNFNEQKRLSSQMVVRSKNTSDSSSDGFYLYLWKDNQSPLPQDLYMKVEFNHAGYGRTIPFMMPFWDKHKWNNDNTKRGIKTFEEILDDWNDVKEVDANGNITWQNRTDGHYGIRQYNKYSYIHLKYQYDNVNDRHYYYIDPETYGEISSNEENELIINLYEAKIE